jgi:hypothetical protein
MYKVLAVTILVLLATGASAEPLRKMLTTQAATAAQVADARPDPTWCWDGTGGKWVRDTTTLSCKLGGTRMCDKGEWRVIGSGTCSNEVIYGPDGKPINIVTVANPTAAAPKRM